MSDQNLTGNKGEWSEIYVFFKLLAEGELYAADSDLNKLADIFYPIIKIIRDEISGKWEYFRNSSIRIVKANTQELVKEIPMENFKKNSELLLNEINQASSRAFSIPKIQSFMKSINCQSLKANPQEKRDITIMVHDLRTGFKPTLGFSIKSQLGGASTLLNASKSTNFIYQVQELQINQKEIKKINLISSRSKIRQRINKIQELGGRFKFIKTENDIFELNLKLIDSRLPEIISEVLLSYFKGKGTKIKDLIEIILEDNPCHFNLDYTHPFYEYKIKNLLTDIALGMTPSNMWNGLYDATGGIIIVREDGEILCYHIYNRNEFQEYLIKNTKLETPSSSRHEYGKLYFEDDLLYFKLNLQIRFIK